MYFFRSAVFLCAGAIVLTCSACSPAPPADLPKEPAISTVFAPEEPLSQTPDASEPEPSVSFEPELPPHNTPAPVPKADPEPLPVPSAPEVSFPEAPDALPFSFSPSYDFSLPVPQRDAVENSYFSDAAFVGDSRMDGFWLFSGIKQGKNLSATGLSLFNLDKKTVLTSGGQRYTLLEALSLREYGKIYLGFGVNELGYINIDAFQNAYAEVIDSIRACQPNAVIYIQTLIPLNESQVAATGGAGHLNNARLRLYNERIRQVALDKHVALLDLYSAFSADGSLPADASRDGVHLNRTYCKKQLDYLKTHTVDFDTLYQQPQTETEVLPHETPEPPSSDPASGHHNDSLLPQPEPNSLPPLPAGSAFRV